jgi:hypothetical protein
MDAEELEVCKRRGHSPLMGKGWSKCEWCGLWMCEIHTIEEREDQPPRDEMESPKAKRGESQEEERPPNSTELNICRRRGHDQRIGKDWSKCNLCGFWLRKKVTREEREDRPPEEEMSPISRMLERLKSCAS